MQMDLAFHIVCDNMEWLCNSLYFESGSLHSRVWMQTDVYEAWLIRGLGSASESTW